MTWRDVVPGRAVLGVGDCRELLRSLPEGCAHAVVTDPPYELNFMGKSWDASGVAFDPATWREVLRVLKPGGYLLAFGGTRTYHRMACAIEDAGFEIRDSIHWVYATGFPKYLDASKAIDKAAGHWRGRAGAVLSENRAMSAANYERTPKGNPVAAAAAAWNGWATALKPAHEPIVVARKPLEGTVAENLLAHGAGAMNIDACRVGDDAGWSYPNGPGGNTFHGVDRRPGAVAATKGRFPPNLVLSHDERCVDWVGAEETIWQCVEGCPVLALDQQSGASKSRRGKPRASAEPGDGWGMTATGAEYDDAGGASRFFPTFYCAKPSRKERDLGCDDLPERAGHDLVDREEGSPGVQNPRAGAGRISGGRNGHPTVKPLNLMRWLVRLVTPAGGLVVDPFCGSGTTGMAAIAEDFQFLGCELSAEYAEVAERRIRAAVG